MEINKKKSFHKFAEDAKHQLESARIPNFESFFTNLDSFNPMLSYLENALYIIDFRTNEFTYIGPNSSEIQGYTAEEMMKMSPLECMEKLFHPLDAEIIATEFFPIGHEIVLEHMEDDLSAVKISYSYRLLQKNGTYKTLLQQFSSLIVDEDRNPLMILGSVSDISEIHTKPELFGRIHKRDKKGNWQKIYERIWPLTENANDFGLSAKEMEIIKLVNQGKSSKEVALILNKSVETVNVQRKKILSKTGCSNMTEVIALANRNAWI